MPKLRNGLLWWKVIGRCSLEEETGWEFSLGRASKESGMETDRRNRGGSKRGRPTLNDICTISHLGQLRVCHRTMSRTNENSRTEGQIPSVRLQAKRLSSRHDRIDLAQRRRKLPFRSILRLSYGCGKAFLFLSLRTTHITGT
jgi:hypothetical protein